MYLWYDLRYYDYYYFTTRTCNIILLYYYFMRSCNIRISKPQLKLCRVNGMTGSSKADLSRKPRSRIFKGPSNLLRLNYFAYREFGSPTLPTDLSDKACVFHVFYKRDLCLYMSMCVYV